MQNNHEIGFRWIRDPETIGEMKFTFDGKQIFYLFQDYPHALTAEQKKEFDEKNPYWAAFFKDRTYPPPQESV